MTDLNAPLDPTERDALAWRMLEEGLDMAAIDVSVLEETHQQISDDVPTFNTLSNLRRLCSIVHDALAYRRQT